jgi:hypothetical protein
MIKNIIMLAPFITSWAISGMESSKSEGIESSCPNAELKMPKQEFIELDCTIGVNSLCKGKYYEKPNSQKLWKFHDPLVNIDPAINDPSKEPGKYDEFSALKVHTRLVDVKRKGIYFSKDDIRYPHTLITKIELDGKNMFPRRVLNTFFMQLVLLVGRENKIYAWANEKERKMLLSYGFKESKTPLLVPSTNVEVFRVGLKAVQLEADPESICNVLPRFLHQTQTKQYYLG